MSDLGLQAPRDVLTTRSTTVVVTRPLAEAQTWVSHLHAAGWPAEALPLIDITGPDDPQAVERLRACWQTFNALMFVSPQAVRYFFGAWAQEAPDGTWERACAGLCEGATPRCWAPGPGTAQALRACGVPPQQIDAPSAEAGQFDSEALWAIVAPQVQAGHRLLLVRGQSPDGRVGRHWLADHCTARGGYVESCVAYQRRPPAWTRGECERVGRYVQSGSVWLFSSSEAWQNLLTLCPQIDWSAATALATHPRIAQTLRAAGWGTVVETRPALPDVLHALESAA